MAVEWILAKYSVKLAADFEESSKVIVDWLASKLEEKVRSQSAPMLELDDLHRIVKVAYPSILFDDSNLCQWLNLLVHPALHRGLRLEEVRLTQDMCKGLKGPRFGIDGVREMLGSSLALQPVLCFTLNAKTDSRPELLGRMAYEAALGGANICLDDEFLYDQTFCRLEARVSSISYNLDRAQQETGLRCLYAANISSDYPQLLERADIALDNGASCLMVNDAFAAVAEVKSLMGDPTLVAPIFVYRSQLSSDPLSKKVLSLFLRLAGADLVSVDGENSTEVDVFESLVKPLNCAPHFLPSMPVVSGPKDLSSLRSLVLKLGSNVAITVKFKAEEHKSIDIRNYVKTCADAMKGLLRE